MADAVSKLYAEIGFKVNQDGLKQAQRIIKELAKQMSDINSATKEAAKQYGIFSKDHIKQEENKAKLAIANEKAENLRSKRKIESKKLEHKELMDFAKLELQIEKYNERERDKSAKRQVKRLADIVTAFRKFGTQIRTAFLQIAGIGGMSDSLQQSLTRSINTRNFLMTTGVNLTDLQGVMQRMVNTGSSMSQEKVMEDILKVSQNLEDIRLGGGGIVPYKLAGIAATGKVMDVIRATEEAVRGMKNATALNLTRRIGLSDDWLASWRFKERFGGDQVQLSQSQQNDIANAKVSLGQLSYGFRLLADQITAVLSPVFKEVADLLRDSFQSLARFLKTHTEEFQEKLGELSKKITDFIRDLSWEKIKTFFSEIGDWFRNLWETLKSGDFRKAIQEFSAIMHKIANILGIKIEDKAEQKYRPSSVGKAITASLTPTTQSMVSGFIGTPTRSAVFSAIDNHVNNVTINGVYQDELKEELKQAIEEDKAKDNKNIRQAEFNIFNDVFIMSGSSGNASAGVK